MSDPTGTPVAPCHAMHAYLDLFKKTFTEFGEDKAQRLGAALAYYTIFSIAPLLLIVIAIAGIVFGQEAASGAIRQQLSTVMGSSTADAVNSMVANASAKKTSGTVAWVIGVVTLLLGASGVFGQLKDALNTIWNVEPKKTSGVMGFVKERFLSMAMVCGVGFLLLVTLVIDTAISAMGKWISPHVPGGEVVLQAIQLVVSFGLVTVLFALIFRVLPDVKISWHDVWFGAVFTAILFVIGKFALALYLGKGSVGSAYGAAGSLVIILVWVYWSAQILFFGAEFTQVYTRSHGSRAGDTSKEKAKESGARVEDRPRAAAGAVSRGLVPAHARSHTTAPKSSGGAGKLALGGVAGMLVGALAGSLGVFVLALKAVKKVITLH